MIAIAAAMLLCFAKGIVHTDALGIPKSASQETIAATADFQLFVQQPRTVFGISSLVQSHLLPGSGSRLLLGPAALFCAALEAEALFFDSLFAQYTAASKQWLVRHPRQYAIFPFHYFW
ncbi:hypothetical protein [Rhodoflexus sp.]